MRRRTHRKEKNPMFRFTLFLMAVIISVLVYAINAKTGMIHLGSLQSLNIQSVVDLLWWENAFPSSTPVLEQQNEYILVEGNTYTSDSNQVHTLYDGVVLLIEEDKVQILCDNGLQITYGGLVSVDVKADERILKNAALGSVENTVSITILNEAGTSMSVDEAYQAYED